MVSLLDVLVDLGVLDDTVGMTPIREVAEHAVLQERTQRAREQTQEASVVVAHSPEELY